MRQDSDSKHSPQELKGGILFLVNSLIRGGSETKAIRLANAMVCDSRDVVLAYLNPPESLLPSLSQQVTVRHLARRGPFSIPALFRLVDIVRRYGVRHVVAVNLYPVLYAVAARRLLAGQRVRVVASINTSNLGNPRLMRQMRVYKPALRLTDGILFGADSQRRLWTDHYGVRSHTGRSAILYNGVDAQRFRREAVSVARPTDWPTSRLILGTVGEFRPEKAQRDLLLAARTLVERGQDVGVVLVGDGSERQSLQDEVARLGLVGRVHMAGEQSDVRPYLAAMDIFVLPSTAVETFSNAALEAMAMGCPVVATRVGGMEEMLAFGGGEICPPGRPDVLASHLERLLVDSAARRDMGHAARSAVLRHFSIERMIEDFREFVLTPWPGIDAANHE